ncbi:MAG: sterol desaturase family protein [Cytophagaceae bacterium]
MNLILNILLIAGAFSFMEFVAWATHKYVMHGFLWKLHKDHHKKESAGIIEKNDSFFLIFASPGILLLWIGAAGIYKPALCIGLGITLYGFTYFLIHDVFIHQRLKIFKKTNNMYLAAIKRAHKIHHKHLQKENGECFGMLLVPLKYFKEFKKIS